MTSQCRTPLTFSAHQKPTVGDSKFSAATSDHMGWMLCDGRTVAISDFQFLFNVIGYSFGGSGTQFTLPNPGGKTPGVIGRGTDANNSTFTTVLGQSNGEYIHRLTIPEMPSHNHGVDGGLGAVAANNSTSMEFTGISTTEVSTTQIYDAGHTHGYVRTNDTNHDNANALSVTSSANNQGTFNGTTATGAANLVDPAHRHPIIDRQHAHSLNPAGGDVPHNNLSPTLYMGNMFIYCGIVNWPSFTLGYPYTPGRNIY